METLNGIKENLEINRNWVEDTLDPIDLKLEDMVADKFKKSYGDQNIGFFLNYFENNIQKNDFSYEIIKTMRRIENKITELKSRPLEYKQKMGHYIDAISRQTLIFQHHIGPEEDKVNEFFQRYDAYVARFPKEQDTKMGSEEEKSADTKDDGHA